MTNRISSQPPAESSRLEKQISMSILAARLIAFGALLAIFLYPMVVAGIAVAPENRPSGEPILTFLIGGAVLMLLLAGTLSRKLLAAMLRDVREGRHLTKILSAWLISTVVSVALREFAAVLGLVTALLTGKMIFCVLFGLIAFVAIARDWPSEASLRGLLRKAGVITA